MKQMNHSRTLSTNPPQGILFMNLYARPEQKQPTPNISCARLKTAKRDWMKLLIRTDAAE